MSENIEFTRHSKSSLSQSDSSNSHTIHGIALGEGDITKGQSGIKKKWTKEALKPATDTLEGQPVVVDHKNNSRNVVGEINKTKYKEGVGILYEGEIYDDELAEKIENGLLEVSIRGHHEAVEDMEKTEEGAKKPSTVLIENISIVPNGASPSNTLDMGEHDELSLAELKRYFDSATLERDTPTWKEGQLVQWQVEPDLFGKIVHVDRDKKIAMVEIHEMRDGDLASTGFTITAGYSDLQNFDKNKVSDMESLQSDVSEGSLVKWNSSGERDAYGKVQDTISEGQYDSEIDGDQTVDAPAALIEVHKPTSDGWEASGTMVAHSTDNDTLSVIESLPSPEELQEYDYSVHKPEWNGTTESEWSEPNLEDFTEKSWSEMTENEKSTISNHYVIAQNQFPPENFTDLKLPVVEPNGDLNVNALRTVKGGNGVQAVEGVSEDTVEEVMGMMNTLANENFDRDWGEEEMSEHGDMDVPDSHMFESKEDAMEKAQEMGLDGVHKMDDMWVPGDTHDDYMSAVEEMEELQTPDSYEIHEPEWDGTTQGNWDAPMLKDFTDESWSDLSEEEKSNISDHFIYTAGEFPPEKFTYLKLPVVEPNGDININGLKGAKGGHGVHAVESISAEDEQRVNEMINEIVLDAFGEDWTDDEDEMSHETSKDVDAVDSSEKLEIMRIFENGISYKKTMTDIDTDGMDNPVVIEEEELEGLREDKSELENKVETLESLDKKVTELKNRQDVLDGVDSDKIDELSEKDNPVILSEERYNELEQEVDELKSHYAEKISESNDMFEEDELKRKFSVDELSEKYESISEETEEDEEELNPDPKSRDNPDEEVEDTEELSNEDEERKEALAELGWDGYVDE